MTTYSEVTAADTDVAAFIAAHPNDVNLYALPRKMWVARDERHIVALMMLNSFPYLALDLIVANPASRPFMRIVKLWRLAEAWLCAYDIPIVCATVSNTLVHYQSIIRRMGFEKIGDELDDDGESIETIYAKRFRKAEAA